MQINGIQLETKSRESTPVNTTGPEKSMIEKETTLSNNSAGLV